MALAAVRTSHWLGDTPKQGCKWYWCYSRFVLMYLRSKFDMNEPPIELCREILRIIL